jgi:predicted permease
LSSVHLNISALCFTVIVAVTAGLVLGIAPALQVAAVRLNSSLGQRGAGETHGQMWMRGVLVVAEIAFACVLLVSAGLLIRSFLRVLDVNMGFRPESAAAIRIDPDRRYSTQAQRNAYFDEALRRVRDLPGVQAVGLTDALPLGHNRSWGSPAKGQVYTNPDDYPSAFVRIVSDGYIKAMGMSLRNGRDFTARDIPTSTQVIVINETMARRVWPGQDPIGQIIQGDCGGDRQLVGVVGDVRHIALEEGSGSEMYIPIRQCQDYGSVDLVVHSTLPFEVMASTVEATLRPIAPELPKGMRPLTDLVNRAVSPRRFLVLLLGGFAGFAVLLASLGIYGVISYSVNRRRQEIGIRMALGASTGAVQGRIITQTLGLAAIGMLLGAAASLALARGLRGLLFGVTYGDPVTFFVAAATLLAVAVLAGYLPARRASRIDPMIALRVS